MTLCDANVLVALINEKDDDHAVCWETLESVPPPLVTSWACFAEVMYLLHRRGGHPAQDKLWRHVSEGTLKLVGHDVDQCERMRSLMRKYADTPMDLADASLVVMADVLNQRTIFTLDSDFFVYRLPNGSALRIVP